MHGRGAVAVVALFVVVGSILTFSPSVSPTARTGAHVTRTAHPEASIPAASRESAWAEFATPLTPGSGVTVIAANGTVSGPLPTWTVAGSTYTLTADFTGGILDERNGSVLNGGGRTLTPTSGLPWAIEVSSSLSVVVENFVVANSSGGLLVTGSQNVSVLGDRISATTWSVGVVGSSLVSVQALNASGSAGVSVRSSIGVVIAGDSMTNSSQAMVQLLDDSDVHVLHSRGDGSAVGVEATGSTAVTVWGNSVASAGTGIELDQVAGSVVSWNNLSNDGQAVNLSGDSSVSGTHNTGSTGGTAITVNGTVNAVLLAETFQGYSEGLTVQRGSNITVNDSSLTGDTQAVVVNQTSQVRLQDDNFSGYGRAGIDIENSSQVVLDHDIVRTSVVAGGPALVAWFDGNLQVLNLRASGGPNGSIVGFVSEASLTGDDFSHTTGPAPALSLVADTSSTILLVDVSNASTVGISLDRVTNSSVAGSDGSHAGVAGAEVAGSAHLTFSSDRFDHAGTTGMEFTASSDITVLLSSAGFETNPVGQGIWATGLVDATFSEDNVTAAGHAFDLENSSSVLVLNVTLRGSPVGVSLVGDANVTIAANWLVADPTPVLVQNSTQCWIYHNNFVGDLGVPTEGGAGVVAWDAGYPQGGNYWSNHTSPDAMSGPGQNIQGADGIVDTPMVLGPGVVDRYPLTTPWFGYAIAFTESGLAPGTAWSVRVNGQLWTSNTNVILYPQLNGPGSTYVYQILPVHGYTIVTLPSSGPWPESRANLSVSATFSPTLYSLTFEVFGLPIGTLWTVVVGSGAASSVQNQIVMLEPNGSYSYLVGKVPGFLIAVGSGEVVVAGVPQVVVIVYTPLPGPTAAASVVPFEEYGAVASIVLGVAIALPMALSARRRRRRGGAAGPPEAWSGTETSSPPSSRDRE